MTVSPSVPASVSITADLTYICQNELVTFTATAFNGGNNPTYQWKLNGNNVGTNSPVYQSSGFADNDSVEVVMTSSLGCAFPQLVTSNNIFLTVTTAVTPQVSISSSSTTVCPGTPVIFTATPVNGGTPSYQWKVNGINAGTDSPIFESSQLTNGDVITCIMTSSISCVTVQADTSNAITMNVGSSVTPAVSIAASSVSICAGTLVTFTASPVNAGNSPTFQWKLNGNNVGNGTATYQGSTFANGDVVKVIMTASLPCANPTVVASDSIIMTVNPAAVTPSVSIVPDYNPLCAGGMVTFTATPTNGGNDPFFQWKVNGNNTGEDSVIFYSGSLQNGDVISVSMTSSLGCASPATVSSNNVTMTITPDPVIVYGDNDGDGYGSQSSGGFIACAVPPGYATNNADCNDQDSTINPAANEICNNGVDDNCNGLVDENCNTGLPQLMLKTYPVKEGNSGQTILMTEVKLSMTSLLPVLVNYTTINDDAQAGADYVATSGVLVIPAGSISGMIEVRIIGDVLAEHNERFWLQFSNPVNVTLTDDPRSRIMIIDDDKGKPQTTNQIEKNNNEHESLKIPTVARRNQVWFIPLISNYENEVLVMNAQGQVLSRMVNYKNQVPLTNFSTGIYFYHIRIKEKNGQSRLYTGKLFISE
jgi:hypothetical protein